MFKIEAFTFNGQSIAEKMCLELVGRSQWFSLTPLPDDRWQICVKEENLKMVNDCFLSLKCKLQGHTQKMVAYEQTRPFHS